MYIVVKIFVENNVRKLVNNWVEVWPKHNKKAPDSYHEHATYETKWQY